MNHTFTDNYMAMVKEANSKAIKTLIYYCTKVNMINGSYATITILLFP